MRKSIGRCYPLLRVEDQHALQQIDRFLPVRTVSHVLVKEEILTKLVSILKLAGQRLPLSLG